PPTSVVALPGAPPAPQGQRVGRFVRLPPRDPIAGQAQNACYDLLGHRFPPVGDCQSRQEFYLLRSRCPLASQPACLPGLVQILAKRPIKYSSDGLSRRPYGITIRGAFTRKF